MLAASGGDSTADSSPPSLSPAMNRPGETRAGAETQQHAGDHDRQQRSSAVSNASRPTAKPAALSTAVLSPSIARPTVNAVMPGAAAHSTDAAARPTPYR